MFTKCKQHGISIKKEDVRILLSLLDPIGSQARKRRRLRRRQYFAQGPNFVWHIDSYDKLKPYGICINGCIDGFSRNIIWLRAAFTNSNPKVIGGYFVEAVERRGGCPRLVRTDMGTENVVVRDIQRYLRRNYMDDRAAESSYITGASTANQRIES
uniref:Integrase core domain-containing protein n=1 Tax=Knipowitschia caucasica TaxID=637954 RepID=A0AAV2LUN5_KNICA